MRETTVVKGEIWSVGEIFRSPESLDLIVEIGVLEFFTIW